MFIELIEIEGLITYRQGWFSYRAVMRVSDEVSFGNPKIAYWAMSDKLRMVGVEVTGLENTQQVLGCDKARR